MHLTRPSLNRTKFQAAAALMQRWLGFVLVWLANLNFKRTPAELKRAEHRLKQLIVIEAFLQMSRPNCRAGGARSYNGSIQRLLMRGALPKLSRFGFDRIARIRAVGRNIARYVRQFVKRLTRGLLVRRCAKRGAAPIALTSHAPACVHAFADTS